MGRDCGPGERPYTTFRDAIWEMHRFEKKSPNTEIISGITLKARGSVRHGQQKEPRRRLVQAILRGSSIKVSTKALREGALCGIEVPGDVPEKLREARVRGHRSGSRAQVPTPARTLPCRADSSTPS